jgi:hypothetical protein
MLNLLFPPGALVLVALLLVVTPLTLLSAESLVVPLWEWVRSWLVSSPENTFTVLPWQFFIKFFIFILLAGLGEGMLLLRLHTLLVSQWVQRSPQVHAGHPQFHIDMDAALISLVNWTAYRWLRLLAPPLLMLALTGFTFFVTMMGMSLVTGLPPFAQPIQYMMSIFLVLLFSLFTGLAVSHSLWTGISSVFGDVIAISDPEISSKTVLERSGRLLLRSPWVFLLLPFLLLAQATLIAEGVLLLVHYDIEDVLSNQFDWVTVLTIEGATLVMLAALTVATWLIYYHALLRYYRHLPVAGGTSLGLPTQGFQVRPAALTKPG